MTALDTYAEALAGLSFEGLDDSLVDAARRRVFDTLGATAVGLATPEGAAAAALAQRLAPTSERDVTQLIRKYVAAARTTEVDDINIASCTTVGSVVVPVAVSAAEVYGDAIDDRCVLTAVVAGYDAMIRLGAAIDGARILYKGIWPTYVTAPFAAAAVGARLLGLSTAETASALSLALARTTAIQARAGGGVSPRAYLLGCAAVDGFVAAQAVAAGLGCDPAVLAAYAKALGVELDEARFLDGLPALRGILDVDTKLFPTSRQGMASIQAFAAQTPLPRPLEGIETIDVYVPAQYRAMVDRGQPQERMDSIVSVAYQMALAALAPERLSDVVRADLLRGAAMDDFIAKVKVQEDPDLTAAFPGQWSGRVRTRWRSGEERLVEVREPEGAATSPVGWEALSEKLQRVLKASGLGEQAAEQNQLLEHTRALAVAADGRLATGMLSLTDILSRQPESVSSAAPAR